MKLLWVDLQYDYGNPKRGLNPIGQYGFKSSFEKLGHTVIPFYYDSYLSRTSALQTDLLKFAEQQRPDMIGFCLFQNQFDFSTLDQLRKIAPTFNWFGDDTWRFDSFTQHYAKHFTYCITTDKYSLAKYRKLGVSQIILSQWAAMESDADTDQHQSIEKSASSVTAKMDISFVGQAHPYRTWVIEKLRKVGFKVHTFGPGWPEGSVTNEQMNQIFRESKISLNLPNSEGDELGYLLSRPKGLLKRVRAKKINSQIKARNFEIPYHGGFQLTDYVPGLEDYFQVGKEVACYRTLSDLVTQLEYYLDNQEERERIRRQGFERAQADTYTERFRKIFSEFSKLSEMNTPANG